MYMAHFDMDCYPGTTVEPSKANAMGTWVLVRGVRNSGGHMHMNARIHVHVHVYVHE